MNEQAPAVQKQTAHMTQFQAISLRVVQEIFRNVNLSVKPTIGAEAYE